MTAWTTPTHVAAGEADSGKMNQEVVDNLLNLNERLVWTAYTPQVDQSSTNITKTVTYAKWARYGKFVTVAVNVAMTGGGGGAGTIRVSLPTAADANASGVMGTGYVHDVSAGNTGLYGG